MSFCQYSSFAHRLLKPWSQRPNNDVNRMVGCFQYCRSTWRQCLMYLLMILDAAIQLVTDIHIHPSNLSQQDHNSTSDPQACHTSCITHEQLMNNAYMHDMQREDHQVKSSCIPRASLDWIFFLPLPYTSVLILFFTFVSYSCILIHRYCALPLTCCLLYSCYTTGSLVGKMKWVRETNEWSRYTRFLPVSNSPSITFIRHTVMRC